MISVWINFVLNDEDNRLLCAQVEAAAQGKDTSQAPITGRCWFVPLSVKLSDGPPDQQVIDEMKFNGQCTCMEAWNYGACPSPIGFRITLPAGRPFLSAQEGCRNSLGERQCLHVLLRQGINDPHFLGITVGLPKVQN